VVHQTVSCFPLSQSTTPNASISPFVDELSFSSDPLQLGLKGSFQGPAAMESYIYDGPYYGLSC